jgi:hypothetical protein
MGERYTEAMLLAAERDAELTPGAGKQELIDEVRRLRGLLLLLGSITRRQSIAELAQVHGVDQAQALAAVEAEITAIRKETETGA